MSSAMFPDWWKAAVVLFAIGMILMALTVFIAVLSCCTRTCCGKSIFTVAGTVQSLAGMNVIA